MKSRFSRLAIGLAIFSLLIEGGTLNWSGYNWSVPDAGDWSVGSDAVLHLRKAREPLPGPRRPIQFALADTAPFCAATVEVEVRPLGHSLILVFAYGDSGHFDYAHLSLDRASEQPRHNGIFHVYGGERVRISPEAGPAAFDNGRQWYRVRLSHDGQTGSAKVTVDGKPVPALEAVDRSLKCGRVGIGSFDETADFRALRVSGTH